MGMSCCGPKSCQNFDEDREGVSDADLKKFGGDDIECPWCGADLYHDAAYCSSCGHAITDRSLKMQSSGSLAKPAVFVGLVLALAGMLLIAML